MSSAHEANTQRLMAALRDKETVLKVSPSPNGSVSVVFFFFRKKMRLVHLPIFLSVRNP